MKIGSKMFMQVAAVSGALAVMIGAFGAHGLKHHIDPVLLQAYQTGVQYHFYHTFAILFVGVLLARQEDSLPLKMSASLFCVGILLFSGSLYVLAISGIRWLGAITPLGGVAFILGWLFLFYALRQNR